MKKQFKNKNGIISVGDKVRFTVENQDIWGGDNEGIIDYLDDEFVIKTKRSGIITIDKGYDAYYHTIEKL